MYRIGQFSLLCKVTVKALRFYEAEGLIEPCRVDSYTGYRYYDSSQLPRVHRILALKQCGLTVAEIRSVLDGVEPAGLFAERKRRLEEEALALRSRIEAIERYLESSAPGAGPRYEVVVKGLPGALVYAKRMKVPDYDSYFKLIPAIGREVTEANPGLRCAEPPYCFIEYHDGEYRERDIDVEFCEAVTARGAEPPGIRFKSLAPVAEAACVMHRGPYAGLREAYAALFGWIDANGRAAAGNPRESYIDGVWNREDPTDWLTEVQLPLRPRAPA